MGLDMYLEKRTYVQNWNHMSPSERHTITVKRGGKEREDIQPNRISCIIEAVAYWRKANHIHKWFVDNCQDGVDDCGYHYVDRDKLERLVHTCKEVKESLQKCKTKTTEGDCLVFLNAETAHSLLPTAQGFFFGSTEYNQYYLDDLQLTIDQIEPLLSEEDGDYYYRSSW